MPLCTSSGPSAKRRALAPAANRASGKSLHIPAPPWICSAISTTLCSIFGTTTLMADISVIACFTPKLSIFQAAWSVSKRACSIAMRASATRSKLPPKRMIGLPNATRSWPRLRASSSAFSAMPIARMQWWIRPGPKRPCAIAKPLPNPIIRLSLLTRTLSKCISPWP